MRWSDTIGFALLVCTSGCGTFTNRDLLRLSWANDILTIKSQRLPGGKLEIWYLEAFCRAGSTDRDWSETIIPFETALIEADPEGRWLRLLTMVDGQVRVEHEIRSSVDDVTFNLTLTNESDSPSDAVWAQPCIRVGDFTGRGQDDYFEKCFIFTEDGLTRMRETHRETRARYTPGQVYVPEGIDLKDVNPRPLSRTRPVNGLVGCISADESQMLAMAWDATHELFQGVIVCIHADFHIGGLAPGETRHIRGKLYLLNNDPDMLLQRYEDDFGGGER